METQDEISVIAMQRSLDFSYLNNVLLVFAEPITRSRHCAYELAELNTTLCLVTRATK